MAKQITVSTKAMPQTIKIIYNHTKMTGIEDKAVSYLFSIIPGYSGRMFGRNGARNGSRFCYELFIEHDKAYIDKLSSAFNSITVCPEYNALFACVSVSNIEHEINASWEYLYGYWLKGSMFEQDSRPYLLERRNLWRTCHGSDGEGMGESRNRRFPQGAGFYL